METPAKVVGIRISRRQIAGHCPYCGKRHYPPYSYWFAVYAYLAGWSRP